ncbi:GABR2-like protein [Mya arenaria]|uniref:GABR2-like protein n=1 Tax=Mya arenaria TaxID=6604 RepID=A0ABY7DZP1_MYAAR|nr:GABR2-like protein [Mya arenaria]
MANSKIKKIKRKSGAKLTDKGEKVGGGPQTNLWNQHSSGSPGYPRPSYDSTIKIVLEMMHKLDNRMQTIESGISEIDPVTLVKTEVDNIRQDNKSMKSALGELEIFRQYLSDFIDDCSRRTKKNTCVIKDIKAKNYTMSADIQTLISQSSSKAEEIHDLKSKSMRDNHAYQNGMYDPKYQWIILSGYRKNWWTLVDATHNVTCSLAELNTTIFGYISTDILPPSPVYHGYAFDGVWVIARAVDAILRKLDIDQPSGRHLIRGLVSGDRISEALNDTNFRGEGMVKIYEYHRINDVITNNSKDSRPIIWRSENGPPVDQKHVRVEFQRVPKVIYYSMCTLSGMGVIVAVFFLVINIIFREHRYIKMSSPNLNNIIIVGCILTYLSVFLLDTDGGVSRAWVLSIGFTLAFGAMFSKTWTVHSIFTDIKLHKKVIKDYKLILVVTVLLFIDAALLVTWQIMDPLQTSIKNLAIIKEGDLYVIPVVEYCVSHKMTIWLILIYAYKGMLLVFGCFLACETRQVSIPALNDSKYISMRVYNVVIMCVCGAAVSFVINDQPTSSFVIIGFFIIFSTTITLCLVFMPNIIKIKRDPTGEERRIRAKLQKTKKPTSREEMTFDLKKKNDDLQAENIRCRNIIAEEG